MRRLVSTLAVTGCFLSCFPVVTWAQTNSGITIFSGVQAGNQFDTVDAPVRFSYRS